MIANGSVIIAFIKAKNKDNKDTNYIALECRFPKLVIQLSSLLIAERVSYKIYKEPAISKITRLDDIYWKSSCLICN